MYYQNCFVSENKTYVSESSYLKTAYCEETAQSALERVHCLTVNTAAHDGNVLKLVH